MNYTALLDRLFPDLPLPSDELDLHLETARVLQEQRREIFRLRWLLFARELRDPAIVQEEIWNS